MSAKFRREYRLNWVLASVQELPSYIEKKMFGCLAVYLYGRLVVLLSEGDEPWNGMLIPTEREFHDEIMAEFGGLSSHPVLKKWLYLPENTEEFESLAEAVMDSIKLNDPRFGVEPKEKKPRKKTLTAGKATAKKNE